MALSAFLLACAGHPVEDRGELPADAGEQHADAAADAIVEIGSVSVFSPRIEPTDEGWSVAFVGKTVSPRIVVARDCIWIQPNWGEARYWNDSDGTFGISSLAMQQLRGFSATSRTDVWGVGNIDGVSERQHFNGATIAHETPAEFLVDIVQLGVASAFAVGFAGPSATDRSGDRVLVRYDGVAWTRVATLPSAARPQSLVVRASDATNVWIAAAGDPPADIELYRWNGTALSALASPGRVTTVGFDLATFGADDSWLVRTAGPDHVVHFDGKKWQADEDFATFGLHGHAIWGTSGRDLWIVGDEGTIAHRAGSHWVRVRSPVTSQLWSVHGNEKETWAGGLGVLLRRPNG